MDALKSFNIKQPILLLKTLYNGTLAIIDSNSALRIIDVSDNKVVGGFKTNIIHERILGSHVDISNNGKYLISILPKNNKAVLFDVAKKAPVCKIGQHVGEVESVAIDPNGRYCVTCGQDGKVNVWVVNTARLAFTLPRHADYVTAIAFSDAGQWIATGSFDRTVNLMNLTTMKSPVKLRAHTSVIRKIVFLSDSRLLSADKDGGLIVWDLFSGKLLKRLSRMNDEINAVCISSDKRFVFVGTKLGYVGLYDMKKMEILKQRYLKLSEGISSLTFLPDRYFLAVGTVEGNVHLYPLLGDEDTYMHLIRNHQYKTFYEFVEENPLLTYSKAYEAAEQIWSDIFEKAKAYLIQKDKSKAKELLSLFSGIPGKGIIITKILKDYDKFAQFEEYIKEGRYPLAYSMAKQYPSLQDSEPFLKLETQWKKNFLKAQELIMQPNGEDLVRTLLAPYRGISEKSTLVQELFAQRKLYDYFKKIIYQKDFLLFFNLISKHPFLKEFPEYTSVMDYADTLYIQSQKSYKSRDFRTALSACEILTSFPDYAYEAKEMAEAIRAIQLFLDAISAGNLANAFLYLNMHPLLYELPEAQRLENEWNTQVDQAQLYAAKGMVQEIQKLLEPYRLVQSKYPSMASVYAQCYIVQLEDKLYENIPAVTLENGIRHYVGMFGIDEAILNFMSLYKKAHSTHLDLQMLKQGSFDTWNPSMVLSDILQSS